jgi:hypothetical protein
MILKIGLETPFENKAIAWALEHPGCFAYGDDEREALARMTDAFLAYQNWVNLKAGRNSWLQQITDFDIRVLESFHNYHINENYEVTDLDGETIMSWFQYDWNPLKTIEIDRINQLLDWSRKDLLDLIDTIPIDLWDQQYPNERWNIRGIIKHIGNAEWWYLERLNLADVARKHLPEDPIERIKFTRHRIKTILPQFNDQEIVIGKNGEFWSPRKLIRRTLWHEKDHIVHINKLLAV